jgi:hypothetical protein
MADDDISSSSGTKFYIGPVNSTANDETAYAALTWVEVKPVESIGEFGDQSTPVNFTALGDSRTRKNKGTDDAGDVTIVCGDSPRNPGQIAFKAAAKTKFSYAFKVVLADAPDANDTDTVHYFRGKAMSTRLSGLSANATVLRNYNVAIDSEIIEVPTEAVS